VETDLSTFDVAAVRDCFPALRRAQDGVPCVFADAPGGTQVPRTVIEAVSRYLQWDNANTGGAFPTSEATDAVVAAARRAGADLLGCAPREIVFGANMTTLAFSLSRSVARDLRPGDEVVVTALDHDANIIPWVNAARDAGADVRWIGFDPHSCTLDLETLDNALGSRTRVVAFTLASNAVGTITAAEEVIRRARSTDALVIADAVHLAPHRAIDVSALGVDVLFCSAYKLFGPHIGIMFLRYEASDRLVPYKVRPALDSSPDRWETGTKNHEGLAGFTAAVDYIARLGQSMATEGGRRPRVVAGMNAVANYEATLTARFLEGLQSIENIRLYGLGEERIGERTPTFALRIRDRHPREVAEHLGRKGIFVWDGDYYAPAVMEQLGLEDWGGAVRVGFCHANSDEEIDRVLSEVEALAGR
jgi:cysteine desulfurase family protein (TIGR01976 family)